MKSVNLIKVFIASPGDVLDKRNNVEKLIWDWNNEHVDTKNVILMPIRWENNSTASYQVNASGQAIINEQIVKSSDILIAIFGSKIGTRTPNGKSGTVEEINIFYKTHKRGIGIFFVDEPISEKHIKDHQIVMKYKEHLANSQRGLYKTYSEKDIRQFITKEVDNLIDNKDIIKNNEKQNSNIALKSLDIFDVLEFDKDEQLFMIFVGEEHVREFGSRWMASSTLPIIEKWQVRNNLSNYLGDRYESVLSKLEERTMIEVKETTEYGNPRLYKMNSSYYRKIKESVLSNQNEVNEIKDSIPKRKNDESISDFNLPF